MQTLTSHSAHTVFTKTAKGRDEIARRGFGLNPRQRRVLIVMDGTKSLSTITEMIPKHELDEIIPFLTQQSFIALAKSAAKEIKGIALESHTVHHSTIPEASLSLAPSSRASVSSEPLSPSPEMVTALTQDVEKLREIKDFMTTTAQTYLGLLAAELIHRIERAKGAEALMAVVGQWHMALRESKHGNRFAGPYLHQITAALSGTGA